MRRYDVYDVSRDPRLCWVVEKEGHLGKRDGRVGWG